ncbi:hypothetical protein [Pseudomonas fluorescens]|uniref:hypothetical protein n=1 Tax=Pseudomonas fluorescens TaxID=294 RepID=UPI00123EE273|nr:hypothetical protein [Pseudomonas fluorescens]
MAIQPQSDQRPQCIRGVGKGVFVTNALTSILLQYQIGRRVAAERFRYWTCGCILAFVIGLMGFAFSSTLYLWGLFTAIFTVGEIIIQPLEFFYITRIAPAHMAGVYYSSQNITYLGAASTPVVCGFILADFNPLYFFVVLVGVADGRRCDFLCRRGQVNPTGNKTAPGKWGCW